MYSTVEEALVVLHVTVSIIAIAITVIIACFARQKELPVEPTQLSFNENSKITVSNRAGEVEIEMPSKTGSLKKSKGSASGYKTADSLKQLTAGYEKNKNQLGSKKEGSTGVAEKQYFERGEQPPTPVDGQEPKVPKEENKEDGQNDQQASLPA